MLWLKSLSIASKLIITKHCVRFENLHYYAHKDNGGLIINEKQPTHSTDSIVKTQILTLECEFYTMVKYNNLRKRLIVVRFILKGTYISVSLDSSGKPKLKWVTP